MVVITAQPIAQTVFEGGSATFGVSATGVGTLSYQWKVNGGNVGTDSTIYNTGVSVAGDDGDVITVDVTDDEDTVTSDDAILTVEVATDYPDGYPCPTWSYSQGTTRYQRRTAFDSGWTRQRLQWNEKGQSVSLQYVMDTDTFALWSEWAQLYGYDWFAAELDVYAGSPIVGTIRFTSDIRYAYQNFDKITVSVDAEFRDA